MQNTSEMRCPEFTIWAKDKESRRECTFIKCNSILLASKRDACVTWQHVWTFYQDYSCRFSEIWFNLVDKNITHAQKFQRCISSKNVGIFQPTFSNGMWYMLYILNDVVWIPHYIMDNENRLISKLNLNPNII